MEVLLARKQGDMFCVPEKVSACHTALTRSLLHTVTEDVVVHEDMDNISVGLVDDVAVFLSLCMTTWTIEERYRGTTISDTKTYALVCIQGVTLVTRDRTDHHPTEIFYL